MNIAVHKNLYRYHISAAHRALLKRDVTLFEQHYIKANESLYAESEIYFHYTQNTNMVNAMYSMAVNGFNTPQKTVEKAIHYVSDFLYANYKKRSENLSNIFWSN